MNREILLRGRRVDSKGWVEGDLVHSKSGFAFIKNPANCEYGLWENGHYCGNHFVDKVDPSTVGQYTGQTDKNGAKIFEGDIIQAGDNIHTFVVKFGRCGVDPDYERSGYVGFYLVPYDDKTKQCAKYGLRTDLLYWIENYEVEVLGNIHDNPELMEGTGR